MRFGLFGGAAAAEGPRSDDTRRYGEFVDYVCEAEALGFHGVFLVEHHFTGMDQVSASLTLLTYIAARTKRLRLGTAVTVLPWHNPVLLAEQVATLDVLSQGRLDLGIGRGYRRNEFNGFCIPIEEAGERYEEALAVLRQALTSRTRFSHHGKRWHFADIVIEPAPVQTPHPPMWAGAVSPASIRRAGEEGFNLLLDQFGTVEQTGERIATYRSAVQAAGRRFDPMSVGVTRALHLALDASEREEQHRLRAKFLLGVDALARDPDRSGPQMGLTAAIPSTYADTRLVTEKAALIGTPEEIVERLRRLQAAGAEYVLLIDLGWSRAALRRFASEIMPEFIGTPKLAEIG